MRYAAMGLLLVPLLSESAAAEPKDAKAEIAKTLDAWHQAAADAKEDAYFAIFTKDAIFMGTDATERWTVPEFRKFAHPYFEKGKAWSFKAVKRGIFVSKDGNVAWFDEELDTPNLGPARGSGVLVRDGDAWKLAHYNLSVPIPNDVFKDVKKLIEEKSKKPE